MDFTVIALFLASVLGGSLIQSISGFGFGIFVISVFPFFLPSPQISVAISVMLSLGMTLPMAIRMRKKIVWRHVLPTLASYLVVSAVMVLVVAGAMPAAVLKKCLGGVLVAMSLYFVFFSSKIHIRPSLHAGLIAGGLSGVLDGLFGMGGPPVVVYFLSTSGEDGEQYFANMQGFSLITNLYTTALRAFSGVITLEVLQYFAMGLAVVIFGMFFGRRFARKIRADHLQKLIYCFMALSGLVILLQ